MVFPAKQLRLNSASRSTTVGKWRRRFLKHGIEGVLDEARQGRPRSIGDDQVAAAIERTLRSTPVDATHWSIRAIAVPAGFSHTTIRRIWTAFGLQPHRSDTFKLSSDPLFVDKVRDIVGLYLSPPNRALVLTGSLPRRRRGRAMVSRTHPQATATRGPHLNSQLEADIRGFIDRHNENPRPYKWTKSANEILASVKRFCQKTEPILYSEL
jgi:Homeodomain-like domain